MGIQAYSLKRGSLNNPPSGLATHFFNSPLRSVSKTLHMKIESKRRGLAFPHVYLRLKEQKYKYTA
jgi:hypothetical protein